jgi:lipopolysaccharide/colanic/teichoic acid biosynthesis glycosyltransferase
LTTSPEKQKLLNIPQKKPLFDFFKRLFDVFAAFFGIIILSPVFAVIAIMIKTQSEGRVFYKSTRMGKNGKPFIIWKFRTMVENADKIFDTLTDEQKAEYEERHKIDADPRIFKGGQMLRLTGADELPQLINILKGDMSCIGPRPILPDEVQIYGDDFDEVFSVRPGVSGWWQVNMAKCKTFADKIPFDLYYVRNRGIKLDTKILFMTLRVILKRKGSG